MLRIGLGTDFHILKNGIPLYLGGILLPSTKGCEAHSDGDVLLHAICDALLGALALGDIGQHFPNNDAKYKDKASSYFLQKVCKLVETQGYLVQNIDSMIALENPILAPHIPSMREHIANIISINPNCISIKATTTEGLGFVGRQEGIVAQAIVLLVKKNISVVEKLYKKATT